MNGTSSRDDSLLNARINKLSQSIDEGTRKVYIKDQCFPTVVAVGATVPFITMLVLYLTKPFFVKRYEGSRSLLDVKKFFWYSMLITIVVWGGVYIFNKYRGFDKLAMMCVV